MARPRNLEKPARIRSAAERLMLENGYRDTSYTAIAHEAGVPRGQVQYYFPKKTQIVTDLLNRALDLSVRRLSERALSGENGYVTLFRAGQVYFTFLLQDPQRRLLTLDVVADREITSELLALNQQWAADFLHPEEIERGEFEEDFAMVVGGAYELCYRHLTRGEPVDVARLVWRMLMAFTTLTGFESSSARRILTDAALDPIVAEELGWEVRRGLPGGS